MDRLVYSIRPGVYTPDRFAKAIGTTVITPEGGGFEYCTTCDDLTKIAIRSDEANVCYHCGYDTTS